MHYQQQHHFLLFFGGTNLRQVLQKETEGSVLRPKMASFVLRAMHGDASCMLLDTDALTSNHPVAKRPDPLVASTVHNLHY